MRKIFLINADSIWTEEESFINERQGIAEELDERGGGDEDESIREKEEENFYDIMISFFPKVSECRVLRPPNRH